MVLNKRILDKLNKIPSENEREALKEILSLIQDKGTHRVKKQVKEILDKYLEDEDYEN